jgi:hypothetical protein
MKNFFKNIFKSKEEIDFEKEEEERIKLRKN